MKEMKTITINGVTYMVTDPDAATINDTAVGGDAWSSEKITSEIDAKIDASEVSLMDRLCPAFTESGAIVTCEPVEGYPLDVAWSTKNLAKLNSQTSQGYYGLTATKQSDNTILVNGTSTIAANNIYLTNYSSDGDDWISVKSGTYTVKVELVSGTLTGATIVLAKNSGTGGESAFEYVALNAAKSFSMSTDGVVAVILQFSNGGTATDAKVRVQIEVGNTATAYEPYAETATITRCGKNLAVLRTYTNYGYYGLTSKKQSDNTILVNGTSTIAANNIYLTDYGKDTTGGEQLSLPNGTYTVKVEVVSGTITGAQCVLCKPNSSGVTEYIYVALNTAYSFSVPVKGGTAVMIQFSTGGTATDAKVRVQIEVGNTATAYEPYIGSTFAPGESIPALAGVNTLLADTGELTVTGRADPIAMNKKTEERLAALEAALINT